jgi:tRNA modification GTPase
MDLTQAEGLADLIDAPTQQAARQASATLQGAFSNAVNQLNQRIIDLRVYVEAAIDFPEEEVDFLSEGRVAATLLELKAALTALITQARRGALLSRGAQIVMTGAPNAGKSSLMNQLANQAVAIVTDIPGTTRDVIKQTISIEGVAIQLSDTAGIRAATDAIEQEGIDRAQAAVDTADIIIEVVDDREPKKTVLYSSDNAQPLIRVLNKIDLSGRTPGVLKATGQETESVPPSVAVSAVTGEGIQALEQVIIQCLGMGEAETTSPFSARERHVTCLKRAGAALDEASDRFKVSQAGELLAEDLRRVHAELGAITGTFGADDLLGEIFSSFCIGK